MPGESGTAADRMPLMGPTRKVTKKAGAKKRPARKVTTKRKAPTRKRAKKRK